MGIFNYPSRQGRWKGRPPDTAVEQRVEGYNVAVLYWWCSPVSNRQRSINLCIQWNTFLFCKWSFCTTFPPSHFRRPSTLQKFRPSKDNGEEAYSFPQSNRIHPVLLTLILSVRRPSVGGREDGLRITLKVRPDPNARHFTSIQPMRRTEQEIQHRPLDHHPFAIYSFQVTPSSASCAPIILNMYPPKKTSENNPRGILSLVMSTSRIQ